MASPHVAGGVDTIGYKDGTCLMKMDDVGSAIRTIGDIPSFKNLDAGSLKAIVEAAVVRSYKAGDLIFREGEPAAGLFAVQTGWAKAYKISEAGREQVARFVRAGECFNEIGAYAGGTNQATVEALEPTTAWIISHEALLRLMQEHTQITHVVAQNLAQRVIHLMELVEDISLRTVTQRLVRMLLDHSSGDVLSRRRWSTQAEMAARLGTVPDVLNRCLRDLVDEGLIEIERHSLRILDRDGLRRKEQNSD